MVLQTAYLAAFVIGVAALVAGAVGAYADPYARGVALAVGVLAAAGGAALTVDARAEGHSLHELRYTALLTAGGILLGSGAVLWRGTFAWGLRLLGFAVVVGVIGLPSTLTLALPIAALAAAALHPPSRRASVRGVR